MFRAAFEHSMFSNQFNAVMWDNPLQLTDYNNGLVPPAGPYDASGYSNGNGPARGRISLVPGQHHDRRQLHGAVQVQPHHTRSTARSRSAIRARTTS